MVRDEVNHVIHVRHGVSAEAHHIETAKDFLLAAQGHEG